MTDRSRLQHPRSLDDLFLFRLGRLFAVAGAPVVRLCEGRYRITRREWRLIAALAQDGPMLSSALAARVHLERGRTSKAITDLAAKGLVTREPRPHDRRRIAIDLTDAARAIYAELFPEVARINSELLAALSDAEVDALDAVLRRLQARAERQFADAVLPKADRRRNAKRTPPSPEA